MPWSLEKIPLCRNNFNLFLKMKSVSAKPGACQLSWRAWAKDTENYLEEMPWPLEKAPLCRNNFNFFLKMNSTSAEPGAFQFSWRAWQKMQGMIWKRCLGHGKRHPSAKITSIFSQDERHVGCAGFSQALDRCWVLSDARFFSVAAIAFGIDH